MTNHLTKLSISELSSLIQQKKISPVELIRDTLSSISKQNELINAYIRIYDADALAQAKKAESEIIKGKYRGRLHGIPIALKDIFYVKGKPVTMGSKIHENFIPDRNATVVDKLLKEGAIITGSLNMDEYAFGVTTANPHYGICRNPWDISKIPGGSSGGSAAAVSANMATVSLGTETGGSLRAPAAFCGVSTLKPTYGRISKHGCFPLASSLDHIGPIAKKVDDLALLFGVLSGYDILDPDSLDLKSNKNFDLHADIAGMVIGIDEKNFFQPADKKISELVKSTVELLEGLGAKIEQVQLDTLQNTREVFDAIIGTEANFVHQDNLKKRPNDYGETMKLQLEKGKQINKIEYIKAQQARKKIKGEFENIFNKIDVLISPTVPFTAPSIGEEKVLINGKKVNIYDNVSLFIRPATLIGFPAVSVPCGLSRNMPVGIQLIGAPFQEEKILNAAKAIEAFHLMEI